MATARSLVAFLYLIPISVSQNQNAFSEIIAQRTNQDLGRFGPQIPFPTGGLQNGVLQNNGIFNGGFPNGGFPNGGFPNGGFPNGGFQNGDFQNGGFPSGGVPTGGFPSGGFPVIKEILTNLRQSMISGFDSSMRPDQRTFAASPQRPFPDQNINRNDAAQRSNFPIAPSMKESIPFETKGISNSPAPVILLDSKHIAQGNNFSSIIDMLDDTRTNSLLNSLNQGSSSPVVNNLVANVAQRNNFPVASNLVDQFGQSASNVVDTFGQGDKFQAASNLFDNFAPRDIIPAAEPNILDNFDQRSSFPDVSKLLLDTIVPRDVFPVASNILSTALQGMRRNNIFTGSSPSLAAKRLHGDDPDVNKSPSQLVESEGYPSEEYTVQTQDGFLLKLFRIPHGRGQRVTSGPRHVVLLQHGNGGSSRGWVCNLPRGSLGFILADAGYDVWMSNSRGNVYSRRHVTLTPQDDAFWDWSFDEMAKYDMTSFIDFILAHTQQSSLMYVGHSQGTTMAFALLSTQPEYQPKVKVFVAMAPVATVTYAKSPIVKLAMMGDRMIFQTLGRKLFSKRGGGKGAGVMGALMGAADTCSTDPNNWRCSVSRMLALGPNPTGNMNMTRLAVYRANPGGTSVKAIVHYGQIYRAQRFQMYDYGPAGNMQRYNSLTPKAYDVSKVNVPVMAFTGPNDWLSDPRDCGVLLKTLPNLKYHRDVPNWNHNDFVTGQDAPKECYTPMIKFFDDCWSGVSNNC